MTERFYFYLSFLCWITAVYLGISLFSYTPDDIVSVAANTQVANWGGPIGAWIADILRHTFGFASYLLVFCFIYFGLYLQNRFGSFVLTQLLFSHLVMLFSLSALFALLFRGYREEAGGFIGFYFSEYSVRFLSFVPSVVFTIIVNVLCLAFSGVGYLIPVVKEQRTKDESIPSFGQVSDSVIVKPATRKIEGNAAVMEDAQMFSVLKGMVTKEKVTAETLPIVEISRPPPHAKAKMPWITKTTIAIPSKRKYEKTESLDIKPINPIDPFPAGVEEFALPKFQESKEKTILMKDVFAGKERTIAEPFSNQPDRSYFDGIAIDKRHLPAEQPIEPERSKQQYVIECAIPVEERELKPLDTSVRIRSIEPMGDDSDETTVSAPAAMTVVQAANKCEEQSQFNRDMSELNQTVAVIEKEENAVQVMNISDVEDEIEDDDEDVFEANTVNGEDDHRIIFGAYKISHYSIPTYNFKVTDSSDENSWMDEIDRNSKLLVQTLKDFGIDAKVTDVNRGPVITLYEIQIAAGIKVNRISALSDDIAMALAASRVRIVAPIPGKSAIGVEIPNRLRDMVTLGDILMTEEYRSCKMELKVALGKDILGKPIMLDLKRQPHLLIAGATGAGKSVCVNALISSLVVNYDPNFVRFIMIDPKMVELQLYNGLPHQLTNVITEPEIAPKALKWAIFEMERRYRLLSELNTRDVERYNSKIRGYAGQSNLEVLPYIVIIVDELADLMMVAPKEMENYITRIAQKARAVGIHLVLATQRPSVDVITGIIKANFPARIAFQVAQKTDSRTIIDRNGAEKLLGKGDMLYQSPMSSFPVRIQGAYVSEDEIMVLVKNAAQYGSPHHIDLDEPENNFGSDNEGGEDADDLFNEALKIIEDTKKASASYLQRRLSIGYNRAARIIERMEELGYIGPQIGSKPREVYV